MAGIFLVEDEDEKKETIDPDEILKFFEIEENPSRVGFIGAGQAGANITELLTNTLNPEEHSATRIIATNTDTKPFRRLISSKDNRPKYLDAWLRTSKEELRRFDLVRLGKLGTGAGGDVEMSAQAFEEKKEYFKKALSGLNAAFIFGGEGGGTGTGVMPKIAELARKDDETAVFGIPFMPFDFEGEVRYNRAVKGRTALSEHCCVITIYIQVIYARGHGRNSSGGDINKDIGEVNHNIVLPLLNTIAQLTLSTASTISRDLRDLREIARGKEAYIASVRITAEDKSKEQPIERIIHDLLHDDAQNWKIISRSDKGLILFRGSFSNEDVGTVMEVIREMMKGGDAGKEISLTPGFDESAEKKALYFICSSPKFEEPKAEWGRPEYEKPEEKQVERAALSIYAQEAGICEEMTLWDFVGPQIKPIDVPQIGGTQVVYVSENFAKFWQYFHREYAAWPREKQLAKWKLVHNYLLGHRDHVSPVPPMTPRFTEEELTLTSEENNHLPKSLRGVLPVKRVKKPSFFARLRKK